MPKRPLPKRPRRIKRKRPEYLINPTYLSKVSDSDARDKAVALFKPMNMTAVRGIRDKKGLDNLGGNIRMNAFFDAKAGRTKVGAKMYDFMWESQGKFALSRMMSPALYLYRLVCIFRNPTVLAEGTAGDVTPWAIYLRHKATNEVVCFTEFKGSFSFKTRFIKTKEVPKEFLRDLCRLIDLMLSEKCPHPYSDLVAGSVA